MLKGRLFTVLLRFGKMRWTLSSLIYTLLGLVIVVLVTLVCFTVMTQDDSIIVCKNRIKTEHALKTNSENLYYEDSQRDMVKLPIIPNEEIMKNRFLARNQHAERICRIFPRRYRRSIKVAEPLYSFAHDRFKWCRNLKVASTFIMHLNSSINSETKTVTPHGSFVKKKFMTVREPYSRLVSGYTDRFLTFPGTWDRYGTKVIAKFRRNATASEKRCGHDITFPEFIKFFIQGQETNWLKDFHFAPMTEPCNPCQIPFDYICHLETLKEDLAYLLKSSNVTYHFDLNIEESLIKGKVRTLLVETETVTRCQSMCDAFRTLWWTFQARGLLPRGLPFPLSEAECRKNITENIFADVCWDTYQQNVGKFDKRKEIRKTIVELFLQVPLEDRIKVRDFLALDFELFGYEPQPDDLFPELAKNKRKSEFSIF